MTTTINAPSVLSGCTDANAAFERAREVVPGHGGECGPWASQARWTLAAFLHAGALGELTAADVFAWVMDPVTHRQAIGDLLCHSPSLLMGGAYRQVVEDLATSNERTRRSVAFAIAPMPAWAA